MRHFMLATMVVASLAGLAATCARADNTGGPGAGPQAHEPLLGKLNLTDEQKAQIKQILATAKASAATATDAAAKAQIFKQAKEQIATTVLTAAQQAQLKELRTRQFERHHGMLRHILSELHLTPAQRAQIRGILQTARAAAQQAPDHQAKMKILKAAMEQIKTDVLTPQQLQEFDTIKARLEAAHGRHWTPPALPANGPIGGGASAPNTVDRGPI